MKNAQLRVYDVQVAGFPKHQHIALTAAKAKYKELRAAQEAGYFRGYRGMWQCFRQMRVKCVGLVA